MFFVIIGTLYYGYFEACSCSYGASFVEGCDPNLCELTGGMQKTYIDSFYMSVVTLSTVGFGDETAVSRKGQIFGVFWMLLSVGAMVNFVGHLTDLINGHTTYQKTKEVTEDLFDRMDEDHNGTLDKLGFLKLQLALHNLASEEKVRFLMHLMSFSQ